MFDGRSSPSPLPSQATENPPEPLEPHRPRAATPPLIAEVDGRRVEIEAADEIVLRCGEASIVLNRDGRVTICGTYVETRARGTNRIRGGSVQIN